MIPQIAHGGALKGRVLLCLLLLCFLSSELLAAKKKKGEEVPDYLCRTTLEYSWKRVLPAPEPRKKRVSKSQPEVLEETHTVAFRALEAKAKSEKEAKEMLEDRLVSAREEAANHCRQQHENMSACVAVKYDALQTVLSRLDFKARATLEASVAQDCERQLGRCEAVKNSDLKCFIPGPPPEEAADKAGGKSK